MVITVTSGNEKDRLVSSVMCYQLSRTVLEKAVKCNGVHRGCCVCWVHRWWVNLPCDSCWTLDHCLMRWRLTAASCCRRVLCRWLSTPTLLLSRHQPTPTASVSPPARPWDATLPPTESTSAVNCRLCSLDTCFTAFWFTLTRDVEIVSKENAGIENGRQKRLWYDS